MCNCLYCWRGLKVAQYIKIHSEVIVSEANLQQQQGNQLSSIIRKHQVQTVAVIHHFLS